LLKGLYILDNPDLIYSNEVQEEIKKYVEIIALLQSKESIRGNKALLAEVEVIFSGWGAPQFDHALLDNAPNLKVVFYGAGSVKKIVSDAFWERNIILTTAASANAIPTAEFAFSQIIFPLCLL
jgi:phosphoglycerate dehydrogenase-like enzyme